jgi:phosphoesterase RecJ-like protein
MDVRAKEQAESDAMRAAEERRRALELLLGAERFLLTGHVRPDGDCLGAQLALARVLQHLGKTVRIVNPDPLQEPYDYLAREGPFTRFEGGELPEHDVSVLLDFNDLERTGPMAAPLRRASSRKLVVDHHLFHGQPWWDAAYVDPSSAATGLLVHRMARELGVALDRAAAIGVFTSIVTDTGWFKYSNTDAETLAVASEMVTLGVEPARMYDAIYQRNPREKPRGLARALQHLEYLEGGRLAVVSLPLAGPGEAELADGDELLDLLRSVRAVEVVLYLREQKDGTVKLSARSKGAFDVDALARRFGGGGHAKAAGATLPGPLPAARAALALAAVEAMRQGNAARP